MTTNIRNPELRGVLWNWKPVTDLLPGRCGASDIDGVIERKGNFLFIEAKSPGERMPLGQKIMLTKLAGVNPYAITVLVVCGDRTTGEIHSYQRVNSRNFEKPVDGKHFPAALQKWWKKANGR